jgi:hypothetical protein
MQYYFLVQFLTFVSFLLCQKTRAQTLDFFVSDIKLQAIYKVIHTSNLSTDWGQHFLQVY